MQTSTPYAGRGIPLPPRPPFAFSLAFPLASPQKGEYLPIRAEIAYKIPKLIYPFRSVFWYNRSVSAFSLQASVFFILVLRDYAEILQRGIS